MVCILRLYFRGGTRFAGGALEVQQNQVPSKYNKIRFEIQQNQAASEGTTMLLYARAPPAYMRENMFLLAVAQCWCHGIVVSVVVPNPFSPSLPFQIILVNIL